MCIHTSCECRYCSIARQAADLRVNVHRLPHRPRVDEVGAAPGGSLVPLPAAGGGRGRKLQQTPTGLGGTACAHGLSPTQSCLPAHLLTSLYARNTDSSVRWSPSWLRNRAWASAASSRLPLWGRVEAGWAGVGRQVRRKAKDARNNHWEPLVLPAVECGARLVRLPACLPACCCSSPRQVEHHVCGHHGHHRQRLLRAPHLATAR